MISANDELIDCLRGMPESERICLNHLTGHDLSSMARAELERRVATLLQRLSSEIVIGLMTGDIDMRKAVADAVAE